MRKLLFLVYSILLIGIAAQAQVTNCAQTLRLARSTYDQGRLHELPTMMDECFKKSPESGGFSKQQKVEGYQLLTLAYIYLEEPEKADETMLELLRTDPYFKYNKDVDPAEFIALYKTFRTTPVYRLGAKFNLNSTQPSVAEFNPVANGTGKYKHELGFSGGVAFELPLTTKLTLDGELHYAQKSFSYEFQSQNPGAPEAHGLTTATEKQTMFSLPIIAQYRLAESRFNPFVEGGIGVDYLLASNVSVEEKRTKAQGVEPQTVDVTAQRQHFNVSILAGAGVKIFVAGGYIVSELRYSYGLTNVNSPSSLLANQATLFGYSLTDGVFKLNSLSLSVGYVQNFFKPKKLKRKK